MEFLFELPNGYSTRDLIALNRIVIKGNWFQRWTALLFRGFAILMGSSFILSSLSWLDGGYVGEAPLWTWVAIPMVIGLIWLFLGIFFFRIRAWMSRRLMMKGIGAIRVTLQNERVIEKTNKGCAYYPYDGFTAVYYYDSRWFLFLDKRHAFVLPEESLKDGSDTALKGFLEQKTGKPVEHIR